MAGGLELDDLQGPFQPKQFYDSMLMVLAAQRLQLFMSCSDFIQKQETPGNS